MMETQKFISVILPLKLEWEPCYSLPEDTYDICVGQRVKVRFAFKEYIGVVSAVGITPEIAVDRIQSIVSIEEGLEKILPEEIELWRKVAEYYLCTSGEVYKAAYPSGKVNLEEARAAAISRTMLRRERLLEGMREKIRRLEERLEKKEAMTARSREGTKARLMHAEGAEKLRKEINTAREALAAAESSRETGTQAASSQGISESGIVLSNAQKEAYDRICEGFGNGRPVLLHGVTGSGKTEIYIKLAQKTIAEGRNVLYLVPEIALSRQLEERLNVHFGGKVITYHSGESAVRRRAAAEEVRSHTDEGRGGYIVLGTRSSLFLPHHNLGLIVVDEEHDSSYKQDSPAPRYNGRDTALMLSTIHGSNIILGSATPSLEELYNCSIGKHTLVRLEERYHAGESAGVMIIDTKAERRKKGMEGNFSRKLISLIRETLSKGEQVMILRSRRAWAPVLQCDECGKIVRCPHCNVSLSYHKDEKGGFIACHYCGFRSSYSDSCTSCGGHLKNLGAGTQRIEEEASRLFPEAVVARLDSDATQNKTYESKIIRAFSKGEIDILVGTQMVTKGFDFSNLTLVAAIAADTLLGLQDFRADEKALQVLEQFRGRCGRRGRRGLFIIQTSQPDHPVYSRLSSGNIGMACTELMSERQEFGYPPYTRIVEVILKDTDEKRLSVMSSRLADELSGITDRMKDNPVEGPYMPVTDKIADQHIRAIRISLPKDRNLRNRKQKILNVVHKFEKDRRYDGHITINVDPA